jgi:hypothetical protein
LVWRAPLNSQPGCTNIVGYTKPIALAQLTEYYIRD